MAGCIQSKDDTRWFIFVESLLLTCALHLDWQNVTFKNAPGMQKQQPKRVPKVVYNLIVSSYGWKELNFAMALD